MLRGINKPDGGRARRCVLRTPRLRYTAGRWAHQEVCFENTQASLLHSAQGGGSVEVLCQGRSAEPGSLPMEGGLARTPGRPGQSWGTSPDSSLVY